MNPIVGVVGKVFGELIGSLDGLFTSDEERLQAKTQIMVVQTQIMSKVLDYEQSMLEAQSAVIQAEATGNSWIQRSWRPITMLTFVALVVARWLGFTVDVTPEIEVQLMHIIQIGLGGYIVGRSGEKIVKSIDFGKIQAKE